MVKIFKLIDVGTVTAGKTVEDSWSPAESYIIHKMVAVETGGTSLADVMLTARIDEFVFTKDKVDLSIFQGHVNQVPVLDYPINAHQRLVYAVENNKTVDVDVHLILILEKK